MQLISGILLVVIFAACLFCPRYMYIYQSSLISSKDPFSFVPLALRESMEQYIWNKNSSKLLIFLSSTESNSKEIASHCDN